MAFETGYLVILFFGTTIIHIPEMRPIYWPVSAYVWHLFVMPVIVLTWLFSRGVKWLRQRKKKDPIPTPIEEQLLSPRLTRRQALSALGISLPPLISLSIAVPGTRGLGQFRTRELTLRLPTLPADLDGLTIAHVTDLHIGRFLPAGTMERVADATNAMQADLVIFTGDLLDGSCDTSSLGLKPGHDFINLLNPRGGMVMIEGNHDMMHGTEWFESEFKKHNLLLDDHKVFNVKGRSTPVQMLGITWGELKKGKELGHWGKDAEEWNRVSSEEYTQRVVRTVASQRIEGAFPILLAHHPHALDTAAEVGLPLVLSGHTHGGQIMLTKNIGAGPLRFRYWAGEYEKNGSKLFVNNGVGNWFPLRVGAPAEIVKLTLRRA